MGIEEPRALWRRLLGKAGENCERRFRREFTDGICT
jgi:hypothetical protein